MFEIKDGQEYELYNGINEDPFTWKTYNNTLVENEHGMLEIQIPTYDAVLLGSGQAKQQMQEVISRYQIAVDMDKIKRDAYMYGCLEKYASFCPDELNATPT